jgi:4-amino-4-deoxy-L-arabinose transferase-like glycosyltransferase
VPRCCAATLPQLGLLLLCAAWLLPGLIGHAPWKGGDGEHFVQLWLLLQSGDAPQAVSVTPPLYYWAAMATAWLSSPILELADGARLASGLFIALALFFVARAARVLYGAEAGWAAALILLGCMGLLVRGHELNAATAQFAAAAMMLYGIASLPQGSRRGGLLGTGALGGGTVLMLLAGGAAEALLFLVLAALLPLWLADYRSPAVRRALGWGAGGALLFGAAWLAYLAMQGIPLIHAANLQRWLGGEGLRPGYYPGILGWYAWPAWPLAAWAVYRGRHQWRTPGIVLPAAALLGLLGLYAFDAHPGEEQGLILLLPLTLLGASGLFTLRRGAANALLWFGLMLFGFIALVLWVYWGAHDLGRPARLAARLARLGMTGVGELRPWTLALGLVVTLIWIGFLTRVQRSPLRPVLVWTAGMTFIWVLLMALFQAPLDRRLSYASVAGELAIRVPPADCIQTYQVRSQQRLLLAYHSGRSLIPADVGCTWLLVETRNREAEPHVAADWVKQWDGARPGDRSDRFHLYGRR